jgi:ABC-type transporter Mla MlaB component
VLSEAQLAGIKNRLNLTPEQERYWPAIAAELRKMEYRKEADAQGVHTASVDTSKMDVAKLKSAGLPLVMSFDDEQKDQFKGLVHLLGIESALPGL